MPSAANVKIDKQVSPENALADSSGSSTPLRQVITLVEHKIRNLEKRKSKLESYRDLQNAGKELNADQKTAVAKYNEVTQTLEFARDIYKQFLGIAVVSEKDAKKQAKKEAAAKNQAELARLREILLVQDALNQMGNESVRDDFLNGRNGAAQLTEADLKLLDDLYPAVTPKHEAGNPTAFTNEVQAAAEHLLAVVDGKPKEVFGGTYSQVKEVLGKIHESGYFDQAPVFENFAESEQPEAPPAETSVNHDPIAQQEPSQQLPPMEMLSIETLPPPMLQQPLADQPPMEQPLTPEQQMFYQQQQQQQPPQQQPPRPITEMLGTGSFFFLQESEIDTPPEQIPSQTFTNQSFVSAPPPPIPLPPLFQNVPATLPPQPIPVSGNNGIEETHKEEVLKPQNSTGGSRPPRPNNQSYYQNNNGYNNRPRQNRNGPRPRHN
ncbi:caprin -like [Asbolus verrucosus]|uniref:Caprin-like n=1 Tax=Asbolus verrucosus TaxID=1661398 RepID=A0A482VEP6_ASBVE|nr:caprin -like [Asbolus verrucosus]